MGKAEPAHNMGLSSAALTDQGTISTYSIHGFMLNCHTLKAAPHSISTS